jgi:sugar phosphate isomerase/epimerase
MSRRSFLGVGGFAAIAAPHALTRAAARYPLDGVMGLQAFDVFALLNKDYDGTLRALAAYGYKALDVLALPLGPNARTAAQIRQSLDAAGMVAHNAHYSFAALTTGFAQTVADAHALGLKSIVCQTGPGAMKSLEGLKAFGDQLNGIGRNLAAEGLFVGYHNHSFEFRMIEGHVPFEVLMAGTDPTLVKFQFDVGNAALGGADPVELLGKYPTRYYSLHVRDVRDGKSGIAVGEGTLDFKTIFTLARSAGIHNYDVETGAPASTVMDKLRISAEYLRALTL